MTNHNNLTYALDACNRDRRLRDAVLDAQRFPSGAEKREQVIGGFFKKRGLTPNQRSAALAITNTLSKLNPIDQAVLRHRIRWGQER